MKFTVHVSTIFECSLEKAFKTPMLCDITKVHTGFWLVPKVTHCTDDEHWGQPGSSKKIYVAPSFTRKGGLFSVDSVIERIENKYWKITVGNFQSPMAGFHLFTGEWKTTELSPGKVQVDYTYTLEANKPIWYPLDWLFAKLFWKIYMRRVIRNIKAMAYSDEPFMYP